MTSRPLWRPFELLTLSGITQKAHRTLPRHRLEIDLSLLRWSLRLVVVYQPVADHHQSELASALASARAAFVRSNDGEGLYAFQIRRGASRYAATGIRTVQFVTITTGGTGTRSVAQRLGHRRGARGAGAAHGLGGSLPNPEPDLSHWRGNHERACCLTTTEGEAK